MAPDLVEWDRECDYIWVVVGCSKVKRAVGPPALLRCAFPEQRRSMIRMVGWVQMASARASNAMRSLWQLGTSVAMS
jgi:hypothetical protein